MTVLIRIISLVVGYAFGLFQTAYIYGRSKGVDIRKEGSGNAGTTNSMRVFGMRAGILTFLGDFCKTILAVIVIRLIFGHTYPDIVKVLELYAAFGSVLGHNFPFYLGFKGGKGIACTAGMILVVGTLTAPICLVRFIVVVALSRYVSLGSILVVIAYLVQTIIFGQLGLLGISGAALIEFYIVSACFTALAIWQHRANIGRLINGTENKFGHRKE
ncbi:MAG: glycerol-3-phosphate 1-O-acyltransferase PlsY [Clostridiales bacterium]|nr:glycerol-3-phosphate 1-O-acyltransferase PlsY [Clostridiales bacterium]